MMSLQSMFVPSLLSYGSGRWTVKRLAKFRLRICQHTPAFAREIPAAAVDFEIQHRHGRLKRAGLAALARFRGFLERQRHLTGAALLEHPAFEIQCLAAPHDTRGPPGGRLATSSGRLAFRLGTSRHASNAAVPTKLRLS